MDKKITIENPAHDANEKRVFNGAWLCAENGEIVSKGAIGAAAYRLRTRSPSICSRTR